MGKVQKILFIILLFGSCLTLRSQDSTFTLTGVESKSAALYQAGEWKALLHFSNEAFRQGFDYYDLRIRAGVACFELNKFTRAIIHFNTALAFNDDDPVAQEYLYRSLAELNQATDAHTVYNNLPASSREKLNHSLPKLREVTVEEAYVSSNQVEKFDSLDLNGEDNLYGESDLMQDGHYFNTALRWGFKNGYGITGAYSYIKVNKDKIAEIGDTLFLDDQYPVIQHQCYLNGNIPLGNGFSILPAFNLLMGNYKTVTPVLASDSTRYIFPEETFRYNSFIGYLSVSRDFIILKTTLFAAYSHLNDERQFQGGVEATVLPLGNLNFYLTSKLIDHLNEEENSILFDQLIGVRLVKNTWAEVNATFGHMINYYEKNAYIVYNLTEDIKFKGTAKIFCVIYPHWTVSGEYHYLLREGSYTYYRKVDGQQAIPVTEQKEFSNHIFLLGLKWKF